MAITELGRLFRLSSPLTWDEGLRILERDRYTCQYCGLDGLRNFENSLIMTVDFVVPRSKKGKKDSGNLVAACRPCNVLKVTATSSPVLRRPRNTCSSGVRRCTRSGRAE
jgi:5-methylcytosine-specific restriction endonuclease McrA